MQYQTDIQIRAAVDTDSDRLWALMRELAIFEKYIDSFAITPEIVRERGFRKSPPDFYAIVADAGTELAGMLVYYMIPFTAQNRPAVYMKELFVDERYRGQKIGERLMESLKNEARERGCTQIRWSVAPWNDAGKRFYERLGAKENSDWLHYDWNV